MNTSSIADPSYVKSIGGVKTCPICKRTPAVKVVCGIGRVHLVQCANRKCLMRMSNWVPMGQWNSTFNRKDK